MSTVGKRARKGNRVAVERLVTLARLLRLNGRFTADDVAAHFEMGRKTICRDLAYLRDRLGYDFEYRRDEKRYVLTSAPKAEL